MSDRVAIDDVIRQFDNNKQIWPDSDPWHFYTKNKIADFIGQNHDVTSSSKKVINAGSAGENYGIDDAKTIHVDLILDRIKHKPNFLAANLETLPLPMDFADLIICVGSVINYSDLVRVIGEFERISVMGSYLILEFECSNTLELLFSNQINANGFCRVYDVKSIISALNF